MAKISEQWQAAFTTSAKVGRLVPLGSRVVPQQVTVQLTGEPSDIPGRGWPDTSIQFEIRDGAITCTELRIVSKATDRPIRTADLSVFDLDLLAELAFQMHSFNREDDDNFGGAVRGAIDESYREPLDELRAVARTYLNPVARLKPSKSVQDVLGYASRETASRRIRMARDKGLIPPPGANAAELDAAWAALTEPEPRPYTNEEQRRLVYAQGTGELERVRAEIEEERKTDAASNV